MNKNLRKSAIAGIVFAVILIPRIILEILLYLHKLTGFYLILYYLVVIVTAAAFACFIWGFKVIGEKTKNKTLIIASEISISIEILSVIKSIALAQYHPFARIVLSIILAFLAGIAAIILGVGILRLKDKFGNLAKTAGILNIICGASIATILFFFVFFMVYIPLMGLEIVLMLKAAKKL